MKRALILLSSLALAAMACNMPGPASQGGTPIAVTDGPTAPVADATTPATGEPSDVTSSAPTSDTESVLPAPVYFIAKDDGQIWRVETDGVTVTQITAEPSTVTSFDVSPAEGSIAYVSNNLLLNVDATGGSRAELFNGGPVAGPDDYAGQVNKTVGAVHWAPDGSAIAFAYGGVQIYSIVDGTAALVLPSDPYPAEGEFPSGDTLFYSVGEWSPNGQYLLVPFSFWPAAGGTGALNVQTGDFVRFSNPDGIVCCDVSWSQDGTTVYWSNDVPGMVPSGLWQATLTNPDGVTLIHGESEGGWQMPGSARQLSDGQLYYFFETSDVFPEGITIVGSMTRSGPDGVSGRTTLRSDSYDATDVLWHPDGLGAVILDFGGAETSTFPFSGPLLWLPADDEAAVTLPKQGRLPHWGQ